MRLVDTEIHSVGYRSPLNVEEEFDDVTGEFEGFRVTSDSSTLEATGIKTGYPELLPSATLVVDLSDDVVLRTGFFRGLSRPDPDSYGFGRSINTTGDDEEADLFGSLSEAVNGITATGNPNLKPLTSLNYDLGVEWYVNDDTILSLALYYKQLKAAFENTAQEETINIDGQDVTGLVAVTQTSDEESSIYGAEITATHAFDYLPGFLSGLGGSFSYNFASSDFEFEDGYGGDGVILDVQDDGTVNEIELIGIIPPANLFGLSEHVTATQLYWQNDVVNVQAIYKTRSDYFQAFGRDTQSRVRYTDDSATLDLRLSYKVLDNVTLSVEGKNVTDEPRRDFRAIDGNVQQVLSYGPRYFAGVKVKF